MEKSIFTCGKCQYFPVSFETQKYFLNTDTYKCPLCQQLTMFDRNINIILESQFFIQNKIHVKKSKDQTNSINDQKKQFHKTHKNQDVVMIFITQCEQYFDDFYLNPINPWMRNSFNIDKEKVLKQKDHPIFSLNNEFIVSNIFNFINYKYGKRRVTKGEHIFYCIDEYIKEVGSRLICQRRNKVNEETYQNKESENIKYFIFSVEKRKKEFQEDNFDQREINEELEKITMNQNELLNQKYDRGDIIQYGRSGFIYKFRNMVEFDYLTYRQMEKQNIQRINDKIQEINDQMKIKRDDKDRSMVLKRQKLNNLKQQFNSLFNYMYLNKQSGKYREQIQINQQNHQFILKEEFNLKEGVQNIRNTKGVLSNIQEANKKVIGIFGNQFSQDIINQIISHSQIKKINTYQKSLAHCFYLAKPQKYHIFTKPLQQSNIIKPNQQSNMIKLQQKSNFPKFQQRIKQHKDEIQRSNFNEQIKKVSTSNPLVSIHQSCLYEPFNKERKNINNSIHNIISKSFKNLTQNTNPNYFNQKHKIIDKSYNIIYTSHNQQVSNTLLSIPNLIKQKSNQFNSLLIFWKQTPKNQPSSVVFRSQKITNQSLLNIFQQLLKKIPNYQINPSDYNQSIINHQIQPILQQINSLKKTQNIIIDRFICQISQTFLFYVSYFDSLIKDNYEQLDFLDQNSLPPELKNFPLNYQNIQPKKDNPFKKSNQRIFLTNQPQTVIPTHQDYFDDSDERESL